MAEHIPKGKPGRKPSRTKEEVLEIVNRLGVTQAAADEMNIGIRRLQQILAGYRKPKKGGAK